jgi:N-acetylmuramoyl-L-alanine amidase
VERLLAKLPNVTPVLTRDRDVYMSLGDRVEFAEKLEGDLFVSVHANATKYHTNNLSARGVELYYLRADSNPDVRALEEAENLERAPGLDERANKRWLELARYLTKDILDVWRSYSADACEQMNVSFMEEPYYQQYSRSIRSARYRVLMNRVMPSILVEVGFMDVTPELQRLADPRFQKRVAILIANGILRYFAKEDPRFAFYQYELK